VPTAADIAALLDEPATEKVLDEFQPFRDPPQVVAEVMLAAALSSPACGLAQVRARGTIVAIKVPSDAWVAPVRRAWRRDVCAGRATANTSSYVSVRTTPQTTYFFGQEEAREKGASDRLAGVFAEIVAFGQSAVGIAPDIDWLLPDLRAAADHTIELATPTASMLSELANRLTGSRATLDLTEEEAARVTPRLLRLSVRPLQDADAYMAKLRLLLAREEATVAAAAQAPPALPTVRDEPTLDRIHGMQEAVSWGFQLRDDLKAYRAGARPWADIDRGLLLSGPPGTGKTMFARALAATCEVRLVTGSYGVWLSTGTAHQGDLLRAMRRTFKEAREAAPSILFIDEIDAFADRTRVKHYPEWHTEVVNTLLAEIDGIEGREGVVVVGACNHPDKLDPALVRSGRLDRHIRLSLPDRHALCRIFREHLGPILPDAGLDDVALLALGSTGADVERMVRGARRRARNASRPMTLADLRAEVSGDDHRGEADVTLASVHEAGHAVAAQVLGIPLRGVSLRQSADQAGRVFASARSDFVTASDVQDVLVALLCGRAAEEVVFGQVTSSAGGARDSDLGVATPARRVRRCGTRPGTRARSDMDSGAAPG
jgi:hypothetical protein